MKFVPDLFLILIALGYTALVSTDLLQSLKEKALNMDEMQRANKKVCRLALAVQVTLLLLDERNLVRVCLVYALYYIYCADAGHYFCWCFLTTVASILDDPSVL